MDKKENQSKKRWNFTERPKAVNFLARKLAQVEPRLCTEKDSPLIIGFCNYTAQKTEHKQGKEEGGNF